MPVSRGFENLSSDAPFLRYFISIYAASLRIKQCTDFFPGTTKMVCPAKFDVTAPAVDVATVIAGPPMEEISTTGASEMAAAKEALWSQRNARGSEGVSTHS